MAKRGWSMKRVLAALDGAVEAGYLIRTRNGEYRLTKLGEMHVERMPATKTAARSAVAHKG